MSEGESKMEDVQLVVSDLVLDTVRNYMGGKDIRLNLTAKTLDIINRVLDQFPQLFQAIDKHIKVIIEDGKFDINDVPQVVLMIKDVINTDRKALKNLKVTRSEAVLLIEGVLLILIDTDVLKAGDKKDSLKALLKLCVQILDTSVDLSETINCGWCCC